MYGKTEAGIGLPVLVDSSGRMVMIDSFDNAVLEGRCYSGANQTGCVWTVGLATTNTGLCVANPIGSGKILLLRYAGYSEIVAPTGIADAWIAIGYHASTDVVAGVAGVARNLKAGGAVGAGTVWTGATLPVAPTYTMPIINGHTSGALSTAGVPGLIRITGALPPGGFAILANFTIGVAVGAKGAILWEEIDA